MPKVQITILEQTTQTKGEEMTTPNTETQGKTTNPMDNQEETKQKILRVLTGALSVLSFGRE
jgi:hypothetical protein